MQFSLRGAADLGFIPLLGITDVLDRDAVLGTANGAKALVQSFIDVGRFWRIDDFTVEDSFENGDGAALFGRFTYTSTVLGKTVTSPFAVLARGSNGKLSYVQFMEDTFATARSFLEAGSYRIKSNPDGSSAEV